MDDDKPYPASKAFLTSLQETCCNQEVTCPITFDNIPIGEESIALPCGHRFSPSAIKTWLSEKSHQCPVCRRSYEKEPISVFYSRDNTSVNPYGQVSNLFSDIPQFNEPAREYDDYPQAVMMPLRNNRQSPLLHPYGTILDPSDLLRAVSIIHEQDNDDQVNAAIATIPIIQEMIRESDSTISVSDSDSTSSLQIGFCD